MSLYGGAAPGMLFTVILSLAVDYFFIPPIGRLLVGSTEHFNFLIVVAVSGLTGLFSASFRFAFLKNEQAKQEAELAVRARDEIVGIVSHELKNPLTALQTGVRLLQKLMPKIPENEEPLKLIEKLMPSIQKMSFLISDLLDVTKLEARALRMLPRECRVPDIAIEVVRSYDSIAKEKFIDLNLDDASQDLKPVLCDPIRTNQVLTNLVGNAIKFTNTGGSVRISTSQKSDSVLIGVTDTGKGMPSEYLPHVFDRFWQAKDATYQGSGLGLAIAKGLVEAQGGRIWVESQLGIGTTFYFTLPVASKQ